MKKILLILLLSLMVVSFFGCSAIPVSKKQVKQDLTERFERDNLTVDKVNINLAKNEGNKRVITATVNMHNECAEVERTYLLIYEYYDVGGWILNDCSPLNRETWIARPQNAEEINSSKIISEVLFASSDNGGYTLNPLIENAKFYHWTSGAVTEHTCYKFVDTFSLEHTPGETTATIEAKCITQSKMIRINETFELTFEFDAEMLQWGFVSGKSIENSYTLRTDLSGKYKRDDGNLNIDESIITVSVFDDKLTLSGDLKYILYTPASGDALIFDDVEVEITGLFDMHAYINDTFTNIKFYLEPKPQMKFGSTTYYKQ